MEAVHALHKHPCPECGADAEWDPAKQALACPYCGTTVQNPLDVAGGTIAERDLNQTLANGFDSIASTDRRPVQCESCQAISSFDSTRAAQRCDFCGSPSIVPLTGLADSIAPESLLPAIVPSTKVREQLREWYGTRWWAPNALKRSALTDTVNGIYLPYWTFDAQVEADWTAESGYHYWVTEHYRGSDGKTHTRQVRKTRWEPSEGHVSHFFDDDLIPGTVGLHAALLRKIEPFPTTTDLRPYDPAFIRGWNVERYQIDLQRASSASEEQMTAAVTQLCAAEVPGDTHRNLEVFPTFHNRTFKHILVPVWLATYTYRNKSFQVVINGSTGKIAGEHPLSIIKITLAVLAALVLILIIVIVASSK